MGKTVYKASEGLAAQLLLAMNPATVAPASPLFDFLTAVEPASPKPTQSPSRDLK